MLPRRRPIWKRAVLWTFQGWLAMFYVAAGFAKLTEPQSNLDRRRGEPEDFLFRLLGVRLVTV